MTSSHHEVRVVGPRESRSSHVHLPLVWTVSKAEDWQRGLSPFHLGPVPLYDGTVSQCMENSWQFSKCYAQHLSDDGRVLPAYYAWARRGWDSAAIRYPMGKGAKPEFCLWGEERLGYVDARKKVYWRLYRDAVRQTDAWERLCKMHNAGAIALWDFDGFDHEAQKMPLAEVIEQTRRPMGHAFVLKAMLLYGADVEADDVARLEGLTPTATRASPPVVASTQLGLFGEETPVSPNRHRRP